MATRTRFSVDTATGVITRYSLGAPVPPALVGILTARDILECEVVFTAGGKDVTADILGPGVIMRLGVRQYTSDGSILAQSTPYTLVSSGSSAVAQCTLDLNTAEVVALVDQITKATQRSVTVYFEVEIEAEDRSYRETLAQAQFSMQFEVNAEGDETPPAAAESANTAKAAADVATQQAGIATSKAAEATQAVQGIAESVSAAQAAASQTAQDREAVMQTAAQVSAQASAVVQQAQAVGEAVQTVTTTASAVAQDAQTAQTAVQQTQQATEQLPALLDELEQKQGVLARITVSGAGGPLWDGAEWPGGATAIDDVDGLPAALATKLDASSSLNAEKLVGMMPLASLPEHTHADLAPLASPALSGAPTSPTPEETDNSLRIANTAFVRAVVAALVNGAPAQLDTLSELADAIAEDRNLSASLAALIGEKMAKDANLSDLSDKSAAKTALAIAIGDVLGLTAALAGKQSVPTTGSPAYASVLDINFAGVDVKMIALAGDVTFTTSNKAALKSCTVIISAGAAARALTWPAGWTALGSALPTSLAEGKTLWLSLYCAGPAETDVYAGGAVSA